ncbi:MAG: type I polyketide synthase, partial [Hyphomicrobiaceae bacterium]|nr:type I polyketide synthase [Hyphomicrobiaceae bacterium]
MTEQRLRELAGGVAIIGVAGRFPGAANIPALWEMLKAGHSAIRRFEPHELDDDFDAATRADPNYVPARPIIDGIDQFDAEFFGYNARDAALTDPQQRVFLECVWSALEDAGYDSKQTPGAIGVFAGSSLNTYFLRHVLQDRSAVDVFTSNFQVGSYQELMGALQDFVATRVAYKLDLRGPAVNVQSACSTSLLAVAQAVQSLQLFSSDMAIAGGVSITLPQQRGYIHSEGGMASADGTCRPFDANATGTIFGSGAGVVVLKRVEDAVQDGDHIYAVIRGVGVNNDGAGKVGFTAPSAEGQAEAIAAALAVAGVEPDTIGYVEAHGTATPLGDPIEFRGLQSAFETANARNYCWLGSIKANVGHLDAAAGVAGLIKTALALDHELLPPQINFERVNSNIQLDQSPFKIATTLTPWPRGSEPRRAGVSAFGVGGTNVHLVLEESPVTRVAEVATTDDHAHLLVVSGRSEASAKTAALALSRRFADAQPPSLSDAAYTLQSGRRAFPYRIAVAARTRDCAIAGLTSAANKGVLRTPDAAPKLLFMFPGQGAQYPGMGQTLYRSEPIFKQWVDRGLIVLEPLIGPEIRSALFDTQPLGDDDAHPIRSTLLAQPALFVIEHALARLLMSRGAQPGIMIGHSLGEFVTATIAGVMSFDDALRLIAARGQAMRAQPPGAMLAVRAPLKDIESLLPVSVEIAAVNAPELVTVAGSFEHIADFEEKLAARDVPHRRLHTSHAFHSAAMLPVVAELRRALQGMTLHAPRIPIVSSVTGQFLTDTEAMSPDYWAQHARVTVRFADAYSTAVAGDPAVAIEVGPGRTLATFAQQSRVAIRPLAIVPTLPEFSDRVREVVVFSDAIGQLWRCGVDVTLGAPTNGQRVSLPGTPFEHKRYWIDRKA